MSHTATATTEPPNLKGSLRLSFGCRGSETYLAESFVEAPLKVFRPFPLPDGRLLLQVSHTTPGVFGGDSYDVEIVVEPGAQVIVVNPAATKLHRMPAESHAVFHLQASVGRGGLLEYYPALNIPFPDCDYRQSIQVDLEKGARLGLLESWAMGRIERGEYLRFRRLSTRTEVVLDGAPIYLDSLELSPTGRCLQGWGLLENHNYLAAGFWCGVESDLDPASWASPVDKAVAFGQAAPGQYYLRGLFRDGAHAIKELQSAIEAVERVWGLQFTPFANFTC